MQQNNTAGSPLGIMLPFSLCMFIIKPVVVTNCILAASFVISKLGSERDVCNTIPLDTSEIRLGLKLRSSSQCLKRLLLLKSKGVPRQAEVP
jgi:hypothetical protein